MLSSVFPGDAPNRGSEHPAQLHEHCRGLGGLIRGALQPFPFPKASCPIPPSLDPPPPKEGGGSHQEPKTPGLQRVCWEEQRPAPQPPPGLCCGFISLSHRVPGLRALLLAVREPITEREGWGKKSRFIQNARVWGGWRTSRSEGLIGR